MVRRLMFVWLVSLSFALAWYFSDTLFVYLQKGWGWLDKDDLDKFNTLLEIVTKLGAALALLFSAVWLFIIGKKPSQPGNPQVIVGGDVVHGNKITINQGGKNA